MDEPVGRVAILSLTPPTPLKRRWYKQLGITPPTLETADPLFIDVARLVPYRYREFHRMFAIAHGFFWIPCPLCDRPFGGHEAADEIPDPTRGEGRGLMICSQCTIERH